MESGSMRRAGQRLFLDLSYRKASLFAYNCPQWALKALKLQRALNANVAWYQVILVSVQIREMGRMVLVAACQSWAYRPVEVLSPAPVCSAAPT
jgi:hypothetical protein